MKPKTFLFPGVVDGGRADVPISSKTVWFACQRAARTALLVAEWRSETIRRCDRIGPIPDGGLHSATGVLGSGTSKLYAGCPLATQVKYVEVPGLDEELTYIVEEPYPATDLLAFIAEDLKRENWKPLPHYPGQPDTPSSNVTGWIRFGVDGTEVPRPEYRWLGWWEDENHNTVGYWLQYTNSKHEHYLRTLHVEVTYKPAKTAAQLAAEKGPPLRLKPSGLGEIMRLQGGVYALDDNDIGIGIWLFVMSTILIGGALLIWAWLSGVPAWLSGEPGIARGSLYAFTASVLLGTVPIVPRSENWMAWHHLLWRFISLASVSLSFALLLLAVVLSWRSPSVVKTGSRVLFVINLLFFTALLYNVCDNLMITSWAQRCIHHP